jgi:hypothetical protein
MLSVHPGAISIRRQQLIWMSCPPGSYALGLDYRIAVMWTGGSGREPPDDELAQCCHYQPIKAVRTLSR